MVQQVSDVAWHQQPQEGLQRPHRSVVGHNPEAESLAVVIVDHDTSVWKRSWQIGKEVMAQVVEALITAGWILVRVEHYAKGLNRRSFDLGAQIIGFEYLVGASPSLNPNRRILLVPRPIYMSAHQSNDGMKIVRPLDNETLV